MYAVQWFRTEEVIAFLPNPQNTGLDSENKKVQVIEDGRRQSLSFALSS